MKHLLFFIVFAFVLNSCVPDEVRQVQDSLLAAQQDTGDTGLDTFTVIKRELLSPEQQRELTQDSIEASQIIRDASIVINSGNDDVAEQVENSSAIVKNPDAAASFPGGQAAMENYFRKKLVYPLVAFQNEIKGTVYLAVVIESSGKVGGVTVKKGLGYGCDESAADCVRSMPDWIPAKKNGNNVRTLITIPVSFGYGN